MTIQYDLFNNTELDQIKEELKLVRERSDNVRKGLFARHNELAKMYYEREKQIEDLMKSNAQIQKFFEEIKQEADKIVEYA